MLRPCGVPHCLYIISLHFQKVNTFYHFFEIFSFLDIDIAIFLWYDIQVIRGIYYSICIVARFMKMKNRGIGELQRFLKLQFNTQEYFAIRRRYSQGEYAKHKFQKIRRLISARAECCELDSSSTSHFERPRIQ